jgi:hypothetical protein
MYGGTSERYKGVFSTLLRIYKKRGISELYRGLKPQLISKSTFNSGLHMQAIPFGAGLFAPSVYLYFFYLIYLLFFMF